MKRILNFYSIMLLLQTLQDLLYIYTFIVDTISVLQNIYLCLSKKLFFKILLDQIMLFLKFHNCGSDIQSFTAGFQLFVILVTAPVVPRYRTAWAWSSKYGCKYIWWHGIACFFMDLYLTLVLHSNSFSALVACNCLI